MTETTGTEAARSETTGTEAARSEATGTEAARSETTGTEAVRTFAVLYQYVPDMQSRRDPHRAAHLAWLRRLAADGVVLLAGALQDPIDGAILVFRGESALAVRRLLLEDPYASAELISLVTVRPIGLAVGYGA